MCGRTGTEITTTMRKKYILRFALMAKGIMVKENYTQNHIYSFLTSDEGMHMFSCFLKILVKIINRSHKTLEKKLSTRSDNL